MALSEKEQATNWLKRIALAVAAVVMLLVLWRLTAGLLNLIALRQAEQEIVHRSQASHLLVRGLLLIMMAPFVWALAEVLRLPRLWSSKSRRRRRAAAQAVLVVSTAGFFLTLFGVSRGKFFTSTGEPQKWCAETPEGLRCFDQPGHDPVYGLKLEPPTPKQVVAWKREELGQQPRRIRVEDIDAYNFFDPLRENRTLVWYGINRQGEIEFFDAPGYHPVTQRQLEPVTRAVIDLYDSQLKRKAAEAAEDREAKRKAQARADEAAARQQEREQMELARQRKEKRIARYLNRSALGPRPQILVVDADGSIEASMGQQVANATGGRSDLFRPAFVADGLFSSAVAGDSGVLASLEIARTSGPIFLFRKASLVEQTNYPEQGLHKAVTVFEGQRYDPSSGFAATNLSARSTGAAFSADEAVRRAERDALAKLIEKNF